MNEHDFKITLLTSDGPQYLYLLHKLETNFNMNLVVIESGKCQRKKLIARKKYIRFIANRYQYFIRKITGNNRYRCRFFEFDTKIKSKIETVDNINSEYSIKLIKSKTSDLCIVMGTSILSNNTIGACNCNIINIHGGYLPYYRGNNCIYFAYLNEEFDKIANTIHFIDEGIDTGDIIQIVKPELKCTDTPEKLYCKAKKAAIDIAIERIKDYEHGVQLNRISQSKSVGKQYKTEDRNIHTDIKYLINKKRISKKIPNIF